MIEELTDDLNIRGGDDVRDNEVCLSIALVDFIEDECRVVMTDTPLPLQHYIIRTHHLKSIHIAVETYYALK